MHGISFPFSTSLSVGCSGREAGRAAERGALVAVGPAYGSEDAGAGLGPRAVGEAAAAGAAPHPEAAADSETATHQRVPEAARKADPSAPGSAPGTPQGRYRWTRSQGIEDKSAR